jgi:molecular chaperone HtpG
MPSVVAQVNLSSLTSRQESLTGSVMVGKDILDLLAGSMYVNPLNVYREYVQNAADSIDEARDQGLLFSQQPDVLITFDQIARSVKIRDSGVGIPARDFAARLTTIGASQKRGKMLRGFRGIGRLSGLGYCQELIFRGRSEGDKKVMEVHWDGRALREKIRDQAFDGGLAEIVQAAVTVNTLPADGFPNRFFEVELRKVSRLRNDLLLNEDAVRHYLSQVAPVPFREDFLFGEEIQKNLELYGIRPPIHIEINDGKGQVFHRAQNKIPLTDKMFDQVRGVEYVTYQGVDGDVCAIGWITDHSYAGVIPKKLGLGGIRLRAGNIQVGDELILAEFFPESRFAGWAMGDIHIISPKILPNGRRDEFEPSTHYSHLQGELTIQARQITHRIRERSAQRNRSRSVQQQVGTIQEWLDVADKKSLPPLLTKVIREVAEEKLVQAHKDAERLNNSSEDFSGALGRIAELDTALAKFPSCATTGSADKSSEKLEKPLAAALKTILKSAKNPKAGFDLAIEVLKAIESA